MISPAGVYKPVEDRSGVFRKGFPAGLIAIALQALGRGSVLDDIAFIGLPSVWTVFVRAEVSNLCKLGHDGRLFLRERVLNLPSIKPAHNRPTT
jgi:hypothetical protein